MLQESSYEIHKREDSVCYYRQQNILSISILYYLSKSILSFYIVSLTLTLDFEEIRKLLKKFRVGFLEVQVGTERK